MPFFRRKSAPAPLPGPQPQQHWVAYMYAPQPVSMPSMYALQNPSPFVQHATYHVPSNAKYGLHYPNVPVQYIYQRTSSAYSGTPHHTGTPLPVHQLHRPSSGSHPISADHHPFPYSDDEYAVDIQTQPAKQGVFSTFMKFARGRSKSRGRGEADPTARPRSRGGFTDDGHDRGRAKDPRYVGRERRLSGEQLKKLKHESQKSFEKSMIDSLEKSLREGPLQQEDPYRVPASVHRSLTKEDLKRKYEEEDRLRQQEEFQRSQPVQIPVMRPSSRNRAMSPDGLAESPTLIEHTKLNARQHFHRPDSGYHTDAPPKSSRRSSMPVHRQMQRLDLASPMEKSALASKVPEGFFNRRGDQLMNSKGDVLRRPPHMEFPPEFADYPPPGTGWQDHKGQVRSYIPVIPSIVLIYFIACRAGPQVDQEGGLKAIALAKPPDPCRY